MTCNSFPIRNKMLCEIREERANRESERERERKRVWCEYICLKDIVSLEISGILKIIMKYRSKT